MSLQCRDVSPACTEEEGRVASMGQRKKEKKVSVFSNHWNTFLASDQLLICLKKRKSTL